MLLSFVCLCVCLSRLLHTGIVGHERFVRRRLVLLAVLRHCLRLRLLQQGTDSDSRRWRRRADSEVVLVENQRLAADLVWDGMRRRGRRWVRGLHDLSVPDAGEHAMRRKLLVGPGFADDADLDLPVRPQEADVEAGVVHTDRVLEDD